MYQVAISLREFHFTFVKTEMESTEIPTVEIHWTYCLIKFLFSSVLILRTSN